MLDRVKLTHRDLEVPSADETVVLAGSIAHKYSRDGRLRALATRITRGLSRVDQDGALRIAQWVKRTIEYRQETPGVEILQGPYTTLHYQVGDCDDLVILWACLCLSIGIDARFAGVRKIGRPDYVHAIGYAPAQKCFYELTDDRAYGGRKLPIVQSDMARGYEALAYNPHANALECAQGGGDVTQAARDETRRVHHKWALSALTVAALMWVIS